MRALVTTRSGGVSNGPWGVPPAGDGGLNLGVLSGDAPEAVRENRARLRAVLCAEPRWLKQVHGATVVRADDVVAPVEADASHTSSPGVVAAALHRPATHLLHRAEDVRRHRFLVDLGLLPPNEDAAGVD